ncbi:MAG: sulfatase modifying factor 1, partial [Planctomycetota bacterium]
VESVNWNQCMTVLIRLGLTLPTETQWEYGLRAGSTSIYWSGNETSSVLARSNMRSENPDWLARKLRAHAPVGSFAPNAFGLHDMTGNVYEWCLDVFKEACRDWPLRDGDGLRLTPEGSERVRRGGTWNSNVKVSRSARRDEQLQYSGHARTGFRSARLIDN